MAGEKKAAADAKAGLEALTLEHSKCLAEQAGLNKKLKSACVEVATLMQQVKDFELKHDKEKKETA